MMTRAMAAMTFVILVTMIGGALGGLVGREVGKASPQFVAAIASGQPQNIPANFDPGGFGFGLGVVSGLFFGAGSSLIIIVVIAMRDVFLAKVALRRGER